jgi:formylglycine-generating enzyme required for sulfatase activity
MSAGHTALPFSLKDFMSFRNIFLGQRCPLHAAALQARETGQPGELITVLTGEDWEQFKTICDHSFRGKSDSDSTRPSVLLQSRADLVLAALGHQTTERLKTSVASFQGAISQSFCAEVKEDWQPANKFRHTAVRPRLAAVAPGLAREFDELATEFGGWNPALLSAAAACAELFGAKVTPDHTVRTHLLFTLGKEHGGVPGKLTLQRINFNANAGGGAVYPDAVRNGFLKYDADFQLALQQAWWRELRPFMGTCNFDICWSWHLVGDDGRPLGDASQLEADLRILRSALLRPVCGRSAGMAFACAFRALRLQEDLDPHMVITADFKYHFNEQNTDSCVVGGVPDKLRADLERAGIDEVLTSSSDQMFVAPDVNRESDGTVWLQPQRGRLKLIGLTNLDAFYGRASRNARMTRTVKQKLAARAKLLLKTTCSPYVRSSLSERRPGDPLRKEPPEVPVPLSAADVEQLLQGHLPGSRRLRLLAESGLGKSTLLIEAEHSIASADDSRIPLRLGAGPKAAVRDDNNRWVRLPLLSDFQWDKPLADLLADFAEQLLGDLLPDEPATTRSAWLQQAVERGEVVFLLDSLDQTTGVVRLAKFLQSDGVRKCSVLLSARPETRRTQKSQAYDQIPWRTVWVDPFDEKRIRRFWDDAPLLEELLESDDWAPLRQVPVLLQQMKKLAQAGLLENLPNREAVYHRSLEMLVQHGHGGLPDSGQHEIALDDLVTVEEFLSQLAWETIQLEATQGSVDDAQFTGELSGASYSRFAKQHRKELESLDQLNLTTRQTYLGESGILQYQFAWRHFSFCEWFAGLHLAAQPPDEQSRILQQHALDERWRWIIRFALSAAQRQKQAHVVTHLARTLLEAGAPFLLWTAIRQDHVTVPAELDELCRWLVHRDRESWEKRYDRDTSPWRDRAAADRPQLKPDSFKILKSMFRTGDTTQGLGRDSRWLHAAWQLVVENTTDPICKEIHDGFLDEFETRVRAAASRNQNRFRKDWRPEDRGLLQLVPDDVLLELGVLPHRSSAGLPTLQALQSWPGPETGKYETRRDQFNSRLKDLQANYCLCPPVGWEHPYVGAKGKPRDPRECRVRGTELRRQKNGQWIEDKSKLHYLPAGYQLQRTPVTNLQFEAFDGYHRRFRQGQWYRPDMETEAQRLDDHPVVEVSPYQADVLAIWMTGRGTFGTFQLPFEEDWEACARAGRDGKADEFGIPWCDEQQRPILNGKGQERFESMSSHGANFNGNYPDGKAEKGPNLSGTVPVGRYSANGFAVVDCHGQAWEWMGNEYEGFIREQKRVESDTEARCVRGGSWLNLARDSRCSDRDRTVIRDDNTGIRLSRTK